MVVAVVAASAFAGFYAFKVQYRKALKDTWAIMFLEGEKHGTLLADAIARYPFKARSEKEEQDSVPRKFKKPDFILKVEDKFRAVAVDPKQAVKTLTAKELGRKDVVMRDKNAITRIGDAYYVVRGVNAEELAQITGRKEARAFYLVGWRIFFEVWFLQQKIYANPHAVSYFTNKDGMLIYSTDPEVTQENVVRKPLVQKFITSKYRLGQMEFRNWDGESYYGFFYELPQTNLVLFSETSKTQALGVVFDLAREYAVVLLIVLLVAVAILQFPLRSVTRPIVELADLSGDISRGNYSVRPRSKGFGELVTLTASFTNMAKNLVSRDIAIRALMREQEEKIRMERELGVAKSLQDNFIPRGRIAGESGVALEALYVPASQVAGDWFTFDYNPATGETIVVVADVSGHDMAASMFTAIIAGIFYEVRESFPEAFPLKEFALKLNRRFLHFGRGKWHATMLVVRYRKGESRAEVMNCGHVFPFVFKADKDAGKAQVLRMPSEPVGLAEEPAIHLGHFDLGPKDTLLIYTDGITETRRGDGTQFGAKRLGKAGEKAAAAPLPDFVRVIVRTCDDFRGKEKATDDQCVVALRISA